MPKSFWRIPQIWDGDTCFIIGGGPSLKYFDIERIRGKGRIIAVNCAYGLGNWFDAMFYGDFHWLRQYGIGLTKFGGLKATAGVDRLADKWVNALDIKVTQKDFTTAGLSKNPDVLNWNQSSGACAINLATLLGAGKIILLGFDMQRIGGRANYHDNYDPHAPAFDAFYIFIPPFTAIAADLREMNIECLNASPGSALKAFPIIDPERIC